MNAWQFIIRSLRYHWRINGAVALGVMAATAVLTGALLVGDSVRGSLRHLTLDRLGQIDEVLVTDHYFRAELAAELRDAPAFQQQFTAVVPAILVPRATVEARQGQQTRRAAQVLLVGSDQRFWQLGTQSISPARLPKGREVVLNEPLAADLGVERGDRVTIRLGITEEVPAESPLGRTSGRVRSLAQLTVVDVIAAEGLGRFNLRASQQLPRNAYVSTELIQNALQEDGRVNALLVADATAEQPTTEQQSRLLGKALRGSLEDYGLRLERVRQAWDANGSPQEIYDYYQLTTDRLLFSPAAEQAVRQAVRPYDGQAVLTYLANLITKSQPEDAGSEDQAAAVSYSLVTAIDSQPEIGPLLTESDRPLQLQPKEIVLNRWAAEALEAEPGDTIRLHYFLPETTHGEAEETVADFELKAVAPLTEPVGPYVRGRPGRFETPPELTNDPHLTPEVEGVTDQESIDDWDVPFTLQYEISDEDERYWEYYRTTPKAFIDLETGQRLWASRFGDVTSFRVPTPAKVVDDATAAAWEQELRARLTDELHARSGELGLEFVPVKRQGLAAARGTTPFDALFLALSVFIIGAALILVALLFRLGIEQRSEELGALLAVGLPRRRTVRLMVAEGALVAAVGAVLGLVVGVAYAWLLLAGLRTWWLGAVQTPFLELYIGPLSLLIGYFSGVLVSVLTIAWSIRQTRKVSVRRLLGGPPWRTRELLARTRRTALAVAAVCVVAAGVLALWATRGGQAQAAMFAGAGTALLAAGLLLVWSLFGSGAAQYSATGRYALLRLAGRNVARHPARSTTTIALMSVACFLIIALSAFRLAPSAEGTAEFDLVAESAEPVYEDLGSERGRRDLLATYAEVLNNTTVLSLRVKVGDDASCKNLYQPSAPRLLGVTPAMVRYFDQPERADFSWSAHAAQTEDQQQNPWRLLGTETAVDDGPVPVVIDKNTAMYSLQLYGGVGETFQVQYEDGTTVPFRVVGLLSNSILQGSLLVGQADLLHYFPQVSGYRYFLIRTPPAQQDQVVRVLEDRLSDQGFDVVSARGLLAELLAVQNTYLSTFQSLGALGLLLGTFGLATVQLRNVLERRGELAVMRAAGFRRRRLATMVLLESMLLLSGGLAIGALAALLVVLPHMWLGGASVPLRELLLMLLAVFAAGIIAGLLAVRATLRAPLVGALRGQ